ncbi:MAG: hypothetical protein WA783_21055, partial [Phormidesmis sp.]
LILLLTSEQQARAIPSDQTLGIVPYWQNSVALKRLGCVLSIFVPFETDLYYESNAGDWRSLQIQRKRYIRLESGNPSSSIEQIYRGLVLTLENAFFSLNSSSYKTSRMLYQ